MAKRARGSDEVRSRAGAARGPASAKQRQAARPTTGRRGPDRLGWTRRAGIVLALLVIGTSIVLAGQAVAPKPPSPDRGGASPVAGTSARPADPTGGATRATARPAPTAAGIPLTPVLDEIEQAPVTAATVDVTGRLPEGVAGTRGYRLRVYVNGHLVRERRIPRRRNFTLRAVPLEQGHNVITAAIWGGGGEGLHSRAIEVLRDDLAPVIRVLEPRRGAPVYDDEILLRGRTEPAATVEVVNATTGETAAVTADEQGGFEAPLTLTRGDNDITIRATDAAGNRGRASITLSHQESDARADLTLSHENINLGSLPVSMILRVQVTNNAGDPVDGAEVTFSLSPPGQSTSTYRTTTEGGAAVWRGVRIPRHGTLTGQGFATVLVVLPNGDTLQGSATFTIR